jgi:hypothetical protein
MTATRDHNAGAGWRKLAALVLGVAAIGGRPFDTSFDPWLRLISGAALAQHAVALFYNTTIARYHFLSWFLTMLVVMVWAYEVGMGWLKRRYPVMSDRILSHPWSHRLASGLSRLQKVAS